MIHEGTHGIQGMDLLGRKVLMENGKGLQLLAGRMQATIARAEQVPALAGHARALGQALQQVGETTQAAWAGGEPADVLANAVPYLQAFGHTVLAWIWLDVALAAQRTATETLRAWAAWQRRAFSSTTNCPRSAPGCRWCARATRPVPACRKKLSEPRFHTGDTHMTRTVTATL